MSRSADEKLAAQGQCKGQPHAVAPVVDPSRCEGKAECAAVCPYDVFEVRQMDDADFAELGLFAKIKVMVHGRRTSYTPRADECMACGLCVAACPESAITLVSVADAPTRGSRRP
ncbi:MAG TPA: ferredoxin family protein [Myxococcales bacterium]|nr:ferredoxin family protein [Myxococcales bacterium]